MPVSATPVGASPCSSQSAQLPGLPTPPLLAVSCENRNVFTTKASAESTTGETLLQRVRSVILPGSQKAVLKHTLHTDQGHPIDISDCLCLSESSSSASEVSSEAACGYAVKFIMQESLAFESICPVVEMTADIVNGESGEVSVTLTPEQLRTPGVYLGQFSLVQLADDGESPDVVILSNMFYVIVGRNLSRADGFSAMTGPPTVAEVRLFLRDTSPAESFLLDNVKFTDEEIAYATQLPVMYWNEIPPPINPQYTTATFPHRYHWLIAITGNLFMIAAEQFRANNLQYSAGGTAVNDQNKEAPYEAAADRRLAEWRAFVRKKKVSLNMELGWGTVSGGYHYGSW